MHEEIKWLLTTKSFFDERWTSNASNPSFSLYITIVHHPHLSYLKQHKIVKLRCASDETLFFLNAVSFWCSCRIRFSRRKEVLETNDCIRNRNRNHIIWFMFCLCYCNFQFCDSLNSYLYYHAIKSYPSFSNLQINAQCFTNINTQQK